MTEFQRGDVVVCVEPFQTNNSLTKGELYIVLQVLRDRYGPDDDALSIIGNNGKVREVLAERFVHAQGSVVRKTMDAGAEEYEEIMRAQEIIRG